jgi:hypothetical protein
VNEQLTDEQLRDLLRARDPAASLPPVAPDAVGRLLEDAMSHGIETPTHDLSDPKADPRRRTPLTWLVAAAAVLVIAGVGAFSILGGEEEQQPTAGTPEQTVPSVLELTAPAGAQGRCAMVTTEILSRQDIAFEGTVTAVDGTRVALQVEHWYRGGDTEVVVVEAPRAALHALIQAVTFEEGGRYLVSATDGAVSVCGFSAEYSDDLAALYAQAFAS